MHGVLTDEHGVTYDANRADELIRRFWAVYIGSKVERDGQVPGFRAFWDRMTPHAQKEADRYCHWAWRKILRDGRDDDECIASGVRALREALRLYRAQPEPPPPSVESVRALVRTILSGFDPPPKQVTTNPEALAQIEALRSAGLLPSLRADETHFEGK
jgi:hypothetical protein